MRVKSRNRKFKDAIYEQFARIGSAVSSPRRLELLDLLSQSPRTVEALAEECGQSMANTSRHLQILKGARLVEARKQGLHVTYRLAGLDVCEFFRSMRTLAGTQLADIDRIVADFFQGREDMEAVDKDDLIKRVLDGSVIVLDLRPAEEYRAGHIPGARSIPLKELVKHLSDLPEDREIVAYCRGPYCVLAVEAVELLRSRGYRAVRLEDGVPEWRARGLPVEIENYPGQALG